MYTPDAEKQRIAQNILEVDRSYMPSEKVVDTLHKHHNIPITPLHQNFKLYRSGSLTLTQLVQKIMDFKETFATGRDL